jgi:hypothetical protein
MKNKKLGVIVPYRDRFEQLQIFKNYIFEYLNLKDIPFELIIVEQDGGSNFNRGKLLNIGFKYAKKLKCDYVVFHDVDMLPIDVDYSYTEHPIHLATNFISDGDMKRTLFDDYFGGVTLFPISDFERINGYSNDYWGWGFEDDDLLYRCIKNYIPLDTIEISNILSSTAALSFNGFNSFVKSKNKINLNTPITIFISLHPTDLVYDINKLDDKYCIFNIPDLNLSLNYNSYRRYNLEMDNKDGTFNYINSDITANYKCNLTIIIDTDTNTMKMFKDGDYIGLTNININRNMINSEFIIGAFFNNTSLENYFSGMISNVAIYNKLLSELEIKEISKNKHFGLSYNFSKYKSSNNLILYYDGKFIKNDELIDISQFNNNGELHNCEIVKYDFETFSTLKVPFRKNCTFKLLKHEENGFLNGSWKSINTRYNQLKFYNEVRRGKKSISDDGLSNLEFTTHSHTRIKNQTHIIVGI